MSWVRKLDPMIVLGSMTVAGLWTAACPPPVPPSPPDPITVTLPAGSDWCALACAKLSALGCKEADGTDAGSCEDLCRAVMDSGVVPIHPDCVAAAPNVSSVRLCNVRCLGQP